MNILIFLLVLMVVFGGAGYRGGYGPGYYGGGLGTILVVLLIFWLVGAIRRAR